MGWDLEQIQNLLYHCTAEYISNNIINMCKFLHIQYESQKAIKAALPEAKKLK